MMVVVGLHYDILLSDITQVIISWTVWNSRLCFRPHYIGRRL